MSSQEVISQLLKSSNIPATPFASWAQDVVASTVSHVGLNVSLQIHFENLLVAQLIIGYLPKVNVAPVLRHLLEQNSALIGLYYCVLNDKSICLRFSRRMEGLDALELKLLLDGLCSTYWQSAQKLPETFQLPLTPT